MKAPKLRFKADDGNEFPEWTKVSFGSLIREYVDKTKEENEDVLLSCAIEGVFLNSELFGHQRGESNVGYKKIQNNTLILSTQNLHLGNANVNRRFIHGIISPAYKTYHVVGCLSEFMAIWVKRPAAKRFFYEATTVGASQCRRNVVWDELYAQTLSLPSLPEQQKIASFLYTIDEIIQSTESELTAWQERKKGVMQKIFNREVRFKADDGSEFPEWEEKRLGEVTSRVTRRNNNMISDIPLTISGVYGLIDQRKYFNKIVAASDLSNYYLLKNGEFAYNRSSSVGYDFGAIKRLDSCEYGAVSTLYVCFSILDENDVCSDYLRVYFDSNIWNKYAASVCAEGARNHGLLNISVNDFFDMPVYIPSLPEQKRIAECLSALDEVITLTKKELSAWKEFKKGLLQQMFV
ncbi:MAG TPA: restriction endonuclease subunit S [Candidatus Blautia excrementipullorum]|nr:restriction endonuclease subunit S [Candidatus Blautia excrementipullorum]